jgi:glycosyltransferase involved in cell wall biosynthesis
MSARKVKIRFADRKPRLLSIIIPIFNEEDNLTPLVERLASVAWPIETEWVFVDDASTDRSVEILEKARALHPQIRHFRQPRNQGKGAAIHVAIAEARGDLIAVQDADLEYDPQDLVTLLSPILNGRADVVFGSRFHSGANQVHRTFHMLINRFLTLLSNLCSGIYLTDMETCYKVFRAEIVKSLALRSRRFGFEPEVTAYLAKLSLRIVELPISYFPRNFAEGKKIRWTDGVAALWFIFKYNFLVSAQGCLRQPLAQASDEKRESVAA